MADLAFLVLFGIFCLSAQASRNSSSFKTSNLIQFNPIQLIPFVQKNHFYQLVFNQQKKT